MQVDDQDDDTNLEKFDFNDAADELLDLSSNVQEPKVDVELDLIQDDEEYNQFVNNISNLFIYIFYFFSINIINNLFIYILYQ